MGLGRQLPEQHDGRRYDGSRVTALCQPCWYCPHNITDCIPVVTHTSTLHLLTPRLCTHTMHSVPTHPLQSIVTQSTVALCCLSQLFILQEGHDQTSLQPDMSTAQHAYGPTRLQPYSSTGLTARHGYSPTRLQPDRPTAQRPYSNTCSMPYRLADRPYTRVVGLILGDRPTTRQAYNPKAYSP